MKKFKLLLALSIMSLSGLVSAQTCTKDDTVLYIGSLRYNNLPMQEYYLKNKCVILDDKTKNMIVNQVKTMESVLLLEKNVNLDPKYLKSFSNIDWLSIVLLREILAKNIQEQSIKEEEATSKYLKSINGSNKLNFNWRQTDDDKNKLIEYLAKNYSKGYTVNKDDFGNTDLIYMLLDNKPEYINYMYTAYGDKNLWLKKNKSYFSALHYMFSPLLKGKNVEALNDKVLKEIPVSYILNLGNYDSLVNGKESMYDYFQFADLMKENNPDFFQKLQSKYKAQISGVVTSAEIIQDINRKLSLPGIDFK